MALKKSGVELVAEGESSFLRDIDSANKAVTDFGRDAEKAGGGVSAFSQIAVGAMRQVGAVAVDMGIAAGKAVAGFVKDSIGVAADFESSLNRFSSVAGDAVTNAGMAIGDFSDLALEMGAKTQYSAGQAADAMVELAKGGLDPATIAAGGLEGALSLAAAGELDLSEAANITAKQLGVWSDQGVTAAQVADRLAQAANASTVDVDELALGMANVGGVAKIAGLSFDETTQAMALLAPGFSSAADAGTSFKTFLSRLLPSTDAAVGAMVDLGLATKDGTSKFYDASGAFIGMQAAAQLLQEKTAGLSEAQRQQAFQTIFGSDAIRAAAMVAEAGASGFDAMGLAMQNAGTASEQAGKRNQGFAFAMESLRGSIETVQIVLGTLLLPVLTDLVTNHVIPAVNGVLAFAQALGESGDKVSFLTAKAGELIPGFTTLLTAGQQIASFLTTTLVPGAQSLADILVTALQPSSAAIGQIWQTLILPALMAAGAFITSTLVPAVQGAATAVNAWYVENGGLAGILRDVATAINTVVVGIQQVIQFVQQSVAAQSVLVGILTAMATRYALATTASIAHAVATNAATLATTAMSVAQGILNAVMTANPIGLVVVALAGLAAALVYAYNHSETFRAKVDELWANFLRGIEVIQQWAAGVQQRFGEVVADFQRGWDLITTAATVAWDLIVSTVSQKITEVVGFFTALPGRITGAIGDLGSLLVGIGRSVISGFLRGINSAWESVKARLGELTSLIPSWKGPPEKDKKLLFESGQLIIRGLIDGFDAETPNVKRRLINLGAAVPDAVADGIKKQPLPIKQAILQNLGDPKLLKEAGEKARNLGKAVTTGMAEEITKQPNPVKQALVRNLGDPSIVQEAGEKARNLGAAVKQHIVRGLMEQAADFLAGLPNLGDPKVLEDAYQKGKAIGKAAARGAADGAKGGANDFLDAISGPATGATFGGGTPNAGGAQFVSGNAELGRKSAEEMTGAWTAAMVSAQPELLTQMTDTLDLLSHDSIIPWAEGLNERLELSAGFWMQSVADGISGSSAAIDAARGMGAAVASAFVAGLQSVPIPALSVGGGGGGTVSPPASGQQITQQSIVNGGSSFAWSGNLVLPPGTPQQHGDALIDYLHARGS